MPIHRKILSGFKKVLLPAITPALSLLPGGSLLTGIIGTVLGGTQQVLAGTQQQLSRVVGPILPPSQFGPVQGTVDPAVTQAAFQADVDRVVAQIRAGTRSRTNVTPRLKSAVDAALGSFVFGQVTAPPVGRPGDSALTRYKAEVLAGLRSIDNVPAGVTVSASLKRELAAAVLKKFGGGAVTLPATRPVPSVTAPTQVAAFRPFQFRRAPTMPVRQLPSIQPIGLFGGADPLRQQVEAAGFGPSLGGLPAISSASVVGAFAAIMRRTGITNGVRSIATWIRGNPATAGALALTAGLSADQLLDDLSEKAMIKSITGGIVLSRNDLKGFNRTVRVAKKLKVFARRAPRRARSLPGHRHTVRSHR